MHEKPAHLKQLEEWLHSYKPEKLFDEDGPAAAGPAGAGPKGRAPHGANPHANGGLLRKSLRMPDFRNYAVATSTQARCESGNDAVLGEFLRDIDRDNPHNFRVFGPDENASNRLTAIYEATKKTWLARVFPEDADGGELAPTAG